MTNLLDIPGTAASLFEALAGSGGNVGEVIGQTGASQAGVTAPGLSSSALSPTAVNTLGQEATTVGAAGTSLSLSSLLGVQGGIGELLIRGLECLAGAALILLGLQALTGNSGNPVSAVTSAGRSAARVVR